MKFALIAVTLALVSGVQITKSGVSDESYDTHFDNLKTNIKTTHDSAETSRSNAVNAEEKSNTWRGVKPQF